MHSPTIFFFKHWSQSVWRRTHAAYAEEEKSTVESSIEGEIIADFVGVSALLIPWRQRGGGGGGRGKSEGRENGGRGYRGRGSRLEGFEGDRGVGGGGVEVVGMGATRPIMQRLGDWKFFKGDTFKTFARAESFV